MAVTLGAFDRGSMAKWVGTDGHGSIVAVVKFGPSYRFHPLYCTVVFTENPVLVFNKCKFGKHGPITKHDVHA